MVFGDLVGDLLDEPFTSFAFPDSFLPLAVPFSFGFVFFRVINVSSESGKRTKEEYELLSTCHINGLTVLYYTWGNLFVDSLTRIRHVKYWVFIHCGRISLFSALLGLLLLLLLFLRV